MVRPQSWPTSSAACYGVPCWSACCSALLNDPVRAKLPFVPESRPNCLCDCMYRRVERAAASGQSTQAARAIANCARTTRRLAQPRHPFNRFEAVQPGRYRAVLARPRHAVRSHPNFGDPHDGGRHPVLPRQNPQRPRSRANFRGTWGNAGTRETTVATSEAPGGIAGRRAVYMSIRQLSTVLRPSAFASPGRSPSNAPMFPVAIG